MIIGIPKEIKESEHRVGMTPSGVQTLIQNGHDVYVQNSDHLLPNQISYKTYCF